MRWRLPALLISFFISSVFLSLPAQAFTIQPLRYKVTIDPGATTSVVVTVVNDEAESHRFRTIVTGVRQDEAGRPLFGSAPDPAEQWVRSSSSSFTLGAGEKKTISFVITAPKDAAPGSHFLALIIEPADEQKGVVGLSARGATLLSLSVSGVVTEAVHIDRWSALERVTTKNSWPFVLALSNQGSVGVSFQGTTTITDWLGNFVSEQPLFLGNSLLPASIRKVAPTLVVDQVKARWPGLYTVRVAIRYGLSQTPVSAEARIWYFPPWQTGLWLAGIAGIIFFLVIKKWQFSKEKI